MNTTSEDDQRNEARNTRADSKTTHRFEPEPASPQESPDTRETAERGYGWGV